MPGGGFARHAGHGVAGAGGLGQGPRAAGRLLGEDPSSIEEAVPREGNGELASNITSTCTSQSLSASNFIPKFRFELDEVTSGNICLRSEMFSLDEERATAEECPDALPVLQVYIDNIR